MDLSRNHNWKYVVGMLTCVILMGVYMMSDSPGTVIAVSSRGFGSMVGLVLNVGIFIGLVILMSKFYAMMKPQQKPPSPVPTAQAPLP